MKKVKFKQERVKSNRHYTEWIRPVMKGYHMACCDCELVHTLNFRALKIIKTYKNGDQKGEVLSPKEYKVEFKLTRNHKLTKQLRNKKP